MTGNRPALKPTTDNATLLGTVVASLPVPVAAIDPLGAIQASNAAWDRLIGSDRAQTGQLADLFPGAADLARQVQLSAAQVSRCAEPATFNPGGTATWWDLDLVPHPDDTELILVTAQDVTARVMAGRDAEDDRHALQPIGARLHLAQDAAGIGTWEWHAADRSMTWSPRQFELHGLNPDGAMPPTYDTWLSMIHPEDQPAIIAATQAGFPPGSDADYQAEFRIRRADTNAERWLLALGRATETGPDGRPTRMLGVNLDITERRMARQALADNAELLRLAAEAGGIYAWEWDIASGRVTWGKGLESALGLPEGSFGSTFEAFQALVYPEDVPVVEAALQRALAGDAPDYRAVFRMYRADRSIRWTATRGSVLRDDQGRPKRLIGMDQDISDLKLTEADLLTRKAKLRSLIDTMPQIVFSASADGVLDYHNRRWLDYSGQTPDQASGSGCAGAVHPDDRIATHTAWADAVRTGKPFQITNRLLGRDGIYRSFLTRAEPLVNADRVVGWVGTATDISQVVEAREKAERYATAMEVRVEERTHLLTEAAVELQAEMRRRQDIQAALIQSQKLEALGELTAGVAHDFNNLLSAIQGNLELIDKHTSNQTVKNMVRRGLDAASRATDLTRQLLNFGRQDAAVPTVQELGEALARADGLIGHAIGAGWKRVLQVEPDVWPVLTDGHQLEVALLNLAINARDAMPEGGVLTLSARNLRPDERPGTLAGRQCVSISVSDDGSGMSPEVKARALEPFFTTKPEGKGTGLGLAMVQAFAARSGGCLLIDSRIGVGTTVQIVLPRAGMTGAAMTDTSNSTIKPEGQKQTAAGSILVVEDDEQVRRVTLAYLQECGYTVHEASNAEAAIVLSHSIETLDLLLTDVELPGAQGPDLAYRLRIDRPRLPIIFMTGRTDFVAPAGHAMLRKPFSGPDLAALVAKCLASASGRSDDGSALLRRMRSPVLCAAFLHWRAAGNGNLPPRLEDLDWGGQPGGENSYTVAVRKEADTVSFEYLRVGQTVSQRMGVSMEGTVAFTQDASKLESEILGSLAGAYERCSRTLAPVYEYASYDLGDGPPVTFERLLLPVCDDGKQVTHLVGVVLLSETI